MANATVSVDVTRAFDHVSLPLLLGLVEPLLRAPHYLVVKYCEVRRDAAQGCADEGSQRPTHQRAGVQHYLVIKYCEVGAGWRCLYHCLCVA